MATAAQESSTGPVAAPRAPAATRAESTRRDHLDGLRAVAVYLVVIFHAGSLRFSGGFIGVDVFFVLSGYLVTQVLLRDLGDDGSIRFGRFYARRVRRLLPASIIAIVVTAAVYAGTASPAQVSEAADAFRSALLYVANWHYIDQATGYFATDSAQSPVLHMWSLSVEEQFYLLWPLLFGAAVWATAPLGRHRRWALRAAVAAGALASAGWALALRADQPDRAYFGTDTRAYQLLAGALLALTPGLVARASRWRLLPRIAVPGALLAVLVLSVSAKRLDPIERGLAITLVTCVLIVALDADVTGFTKRALSTRPAVYLGRVSYGTYLWHWPIVILITELRLVEPKPLAAIVALLATGLASLSYHLVEVPVRASTALDRRSWPVVATGLTFSVVAALVVLPRITEPDARPPVSVAAPATTSDFTPVPAWFDHDTVFNAGFGKTVDCVDKAPEVCTVVRGTGRHVLLMGDSNAQMWIPAFTKMAEDEDLTLSLAVTPGCLWQRDAYKLSAAIIEACRRTKIDAYDRVIPALDPDLIVLANAREPHGAPRAEYHETTLNATLRRTTPASLEVLGAGDRDLLIIESAPTPTDDTTNPLDCLSEAEVVESCRFVASTVVDWHTQFERDLAEASDQLDTVDFDRLVCPFAPICDPIIGRTVVFWNGFHLTAAYAESLAPDVARYLEAQGLIGQG